MKAIMNLVFYDINSLCFKIYIEQQCSFFFLSILLSNLGVIEDVQTFHVPHLCNN